MSSGTRGIVFMRRIVFGLVALALVASACAGNGADERLVFVDFSHDELASSLMYNFPEKVTVRPGQTLVFCQTWTGEPHTITGGTLVDDNLGNIAPFETFFETFFPLSFSEPSIPDPDSPSDFTFAEFVEAVEGAANEELAEAFLEAYRNLRDEGVPLPDLDDPPDMPFAEVVEIVDAEDPFRALPHPFDEETDNIAQNVGQPCYLENGAPPPDPQTPCSAEEQVQPPFHGTHSYYNSGIIPFEGERRNTFRVPLSDDIAPGTYLFYCAVHGPRQRTEVEVVPADSEVPSAESLARQARQEIAEVADPLISFFEEAAREGVVKTPTGVEVEGPFAGLVSPDDFFSLVNEFVPRRMEVAVGEPVTWKVMGFPHTITFDVPEYFPIVEFAGDGTVSYNELIDPPAGGAPDLPPPPVLAEDPSIDGGTYDGEGFWSSGLIEPFVAPDGYVEYTLRISEPGSYRYACLLHPPMVGTLVVTG